MSDHPRESWAATPAVRMRMQGNRGRDSKPELALRRAVHGLGLRYRVAARPLPHLRRTADMVFTRRKVAVFLDGCFWHGCPTHQSKVSTNSKYWTDKILRNQERDTETNIALMRSGWQVIRVWEHVDPHSAALRIASVVRGASGPSFITICD